MALGLKILLIYFRHIKVSWVKAYQIFCFYLHFNVSPTRIADLVRNVSDEKIYRRVGGPEASEVAAMMYAYFFQSVVQKNLKSLYQSFVPQKFASAHMCANRYNRKNKFLVRSIYFLIFQ